MKSKYLSRKFIVCIVGLVLSIVATFVGNTVVALGVIALAGCFVIGESIVDKAATIKRETKITEQRYLDNLKEDK